MNIFVSKLSFDTQGEGLKVAFEKYGKVNSAKVITDRDSGRSRGFGFVEMENTEEAETAIAELDNSELDGRTIIVKVAQPRKDNKRF